MQRTFASQSKMRFEGIPFCSIRLVVERNEQPSVGSRKVLNGSIDLEWSISLELNATNYPRTLSLPTVVERILRLWDTTGCRIT